MLTKDNDLMGSDEAPTTSPDEFEARIARRRKKLVEGTNTSTNVGEQKIPNDVSNEYPVVEGKKRHKAGKKAETPVVDE